MAGDDTDSEDLAGGTKEGNQGFSSKRPFSFLDSDAYKDHRSPLVGRFLRDYIDRLDDDVAELKPYREMYYDIKSKLDVLQERKTLTQTAAGVSSLLLALGGLGIGVAKDVSELEMGLGVMIAIASGLLVIGSFLIRVRGS